MERTTGSLVDKAAVLFTDRPWLYYDGEVTTFGELKERSDSAAAELLKLGVTRGDRVVFCAPNSPDLIFQWLGANKVGAAFVPLNPAAPVNDLAGVVQRIRPGAMILDARAEASADLADSPPDGVAVAGLDEIAAGRDAPRFLPEIAADGIAALIATSGTTGVSKLVMHSHATYVLTAEGFPWWLGLGEADRLMTSLPLFHLNAQVYSTLGSLVAGAALVLLPRFSASRFWDDAAEHGATEVNVIGAMLEILMRRPERDVERNHGVRIVYTAPAFTEERHREIEQRFGASVVIGYGLSESPYGAIWPRGETPYGSMGRLRQHPELGEINTARIVNVEGLDVADGETGELLLNNPAVMRGYFDMPEETAAALEGGWLHTGDLVYEDRDGYLHFVSRKKHAIRRRGENLSPAEVEAVLDACPAVVESAVIGVASELSDEDVKAFVIPDHDTTAVELWEWCTARLARFKVPRYIEFVEKLPHTPTRRIAKDELPGQLTGREHDAEPGT